MNHITIERFQVKQWLEALKDIDALHHSQEPESMYAKKAIADMEQALAQPAQEHVAWMYDDDNKLIPLFTAPPQRPWVGLEGEEIRYLWGEATKPDRSTMTMVTSFAQAIEAALRSKNT